MAGKAADHTLLSRFYTNDTQVKEAVDSFVEELKKASGEQSIFRMHAKNGFQTLFNPKDTKARAELWHELGYKFAKHLGKLLDESQMPKEIMFCAGANPFDKEMRIPGNRQKIAKERYERNMGPAIHRDIKEQLYDLYKAISKDIPVETSHYTASQSIPIVHFGRRIVKEDEQKFKFKGIGVRED